MGSEQPVVPHGLRALFAGRPDEPGVSWDDWLAGLPRLVSGALSRWQLTVDGESRYGRSALVVPVRRADGTRAALTVRAPHAAARHEHLALRAWDGHGAVGLLAADPARSTLLLARLDPDRDLSMLPDDEACSVIGSLLARLDGPALPQLTRLSGWTQRALAQTESPHVPRRFVQQARSMARDLLTDDVDTRIVHANLHAGNVLFGPAGWTAIAPRPLAAEPAFGVWPVLRPRRAEPADDLAWTVHCRLGWVCDAAGIDEDRARGWALIRTVADAVGVAARGDAATLTARITLAKALAQPL